MGISKFGLLLSTLAATSILTPACSNSSNEVDFEGAQRTSYLGATSTWNLSGVPWRDQVQNIRDRAYSYCLRKYPKDNLCFETQDQSIKVAVDVERDVQEVIRHPAKVGILGIGKQFGEAILMQPGQKHFENARAYCFSIYHDSGSADARSLGPCMANTVGWDYFGFLPVP